MTGHFFLQAFALSLIVLFWGCGIIALLGFIDEMIEGH